MKQQNEFVESLHDVFSQFGAIEARRMFGGYGIYHNALMFALVVDDVLYLKADKKLVPSFVERDLTPFEFNRNGKTVQMSYYMAPEEVFDEPEQAREWAKHAYEAALRSRKPKKK